MRLSLSIVAVLAAFSAAGAQPAVLADGREAEGPGDVSAWAARAPVMAATDAARVHWQGQDASYEEAVAAFDVAEGAFTAAGARQQAILYMMSPWPRCCPKMGIAFVEADRLVLNIAFEGPAQTLDAAPDLDGDGRDELVFTGEFGMGGQVTRGVTLSSFGPSGLTDVGGATIYDSACGAGAGGGVSSATRVLAGPGFSLSAERFTRPCDGGAWVPTGPAERLVLEPAADLRYVEIPLPAGAAGPAGTLSSTLAAARREAGRLDAGDRMLTSGEYVDTYEMECRAGRTVVMDLRATDFDPYLIFRPPAGDQIDNDDHEGDRTHSRIEATPSQSGSCDVLVTSYQVGETGAYELTVTGAD